MVSIEVCGVSILLPSTVETVMGTDRSGMQAALKAILTFRCLLTSPSIYHNSICFTHVN